MTIEKTESEFRKAAMLKTLRSVVRLKYSLLADQEMNSLIPAAERAFDKALQHGVLPGSIDVEQIARSVVPE